jgi:hypothetical protein
MRWLGLGGLNIRFFIINVLFALKCVDNTKCRSPKNTKCR